MKNQTARNEFKRDLAATQRLIGKIEFGFDVGTVDSSTKNNDYVERLKDHVRKLKKLIKHN